MSDMQASKIDNARLSSDLVQDLIKERRRDRLWKNVRFLVVVCLILVVLFLSVGKNRPDISGPGDSDKYVSLVRLDGMIGPGEGFSAEQVVPALQEAFADKEAKGVVLDIDSGGGTPVQASIIHDEILKLKKKYNKRVIVVGEDTLASGAYFVAVSADKIYVNPNTVTGSIGVIMEGFGYADIMKKVGIDRRVYASGIHKDRLDPFLPEDKDNIDKVHRLLDEVHESFNQAVLQGRKGKLHGDPVELFSGDFWTGQTALKLGLVDALGNLSDAMQTEFQVTRVKDYSEGKNPLRSLLSKLGMTFQLPLSQAHLRFQEKL
ncbi:MAG: S49 family peptidase [Gammaproteobacteria bacterium]|nr:S49 family peptidase [Gammaproteobacteria bacterium]